MFIKKLTLTASTIEVSVQVLEDKQFQYVWLVCHSDASYEGSWTGKKLKMVARSKGYLGVWEWLVGQGWVLGLELYEEVKRRWECRGPTNVRLVLLNPLLCISHV